MRSGVANLPTHEAQRSSASKPRTLAEAHHVFRRWLGNEYDLEALDAVLAAAAAERLPGDPLWLLVVSGSGNAKTETVQTLAGAGAIVTSISSEGALLSASAKRERAKDATGRLLRRIGSRGLLVVKDVTSILAMNRDTRASLLAGLREIHDGRWERNVGTDGGKSLTWTGRLRDHEMSGQRSFPRTIAPATSGALGWGGLHTERSVTAALGSGSRTPVRRRFRVRCCPAL